MANSPVRRHTGHACFLWVKPAGGSRHSKRDQHTRVRSDINNTRKFIHVKTMSSGSESSVKHWNSNSSSPIPASYSASSRIKPQHEYRLNAAYREFFSVFPGKSHRSILSCVMTPYSLSLSNTSHAVQLRQSVALYNIRNWHVTAVDTTVCYYYNSTVYGYILRTIFK